MNHEDSCVQGIFHMPPWPNFPPWPCLDSQLPSNTELYLLCHTDESGRTLRLRTTCLSFTVLGILHFLIYHDNDDIKMGLPEKVNNFFRKNSNYSKFQYEVYNIVVTNVSHDVPIVFSQSLHKLLHAGFRLAFMQFRTFQNQRQAWSFSCSKLMRESNQSKVPGSLTLTLVSTKFTLVLLLSKKLGLKHNRGSNACQFPWRIVAVAHPQDFSTCMCFLSAAVEA